MGKVTSEMKQQMEQLRKQGLSQRVIATNLGLAQSTIGYWLNPKNRKHKSEYRKRPTSSKTREKHRLACLKWNRGHREYFRNYMKEYNKKRPNRNNGNSKRTAKQHNAQQYIQRHPELRDVKCELCGAKENICAHHPDYDYPAIIITVCKCCHNWIHNAIAYSV